MAQDVRRLGAEGMVTADMRMRVRERDCPAVVGRRDHVVEVTLIGTAIASFANAGHPQARPPLAIMRLGPQLSQAVWPDVSGPGQPAFVSGKGAVNAT